MGLLILILYLRQKWNQISDNNSFSEMAKGTINNPLIFRVAPIDQRNFFVDIYYMNIVYSAIAKIMWLILFIIPIIFININFVRYILIIIYFLSVKTEYFYYKKRKKIFMEIINEDKSIYSVIYNNVKCAYRSILIYQIYLYLIIIIIFLITLK